jgi:hypothetical protein
MTSQVTLTGPRFPSFLSSFRWLIEHFKGQKRLAQGGIASTAHGAMGLSPSVSDSQQLCRPFACFIGILNTFRLQISDGPRSN